MYLNKCSPQSWWVEVVKRFGISEESDAANFEYLEEVPQMPEDKKTRSKVSARSSFSYFPTIRQRTQVRYQCSNTCLVEAGICRYFKSVSSY